MQGGPGKIQAAGGPPSLDLSPDRGGKSGDGSGAAVNLLAAWAMLSPRFVEENHGSRIVSGCLLHAIGFELIGIIIIIARVETRKVSIKI